MSKFDKLKEQRREVKARPFLEVELRGADDNFVVDDTPLTVRLNPPSMAYIVSSKFITTNILRHSDTYKNKIVNNQVANDEQESVVKKAMNEIAQKMVATEESQLEQIGVITGIGSHYLVEMAVDCYYHEELPEGTSPDIRPVIFVLMPAEIEAAQEKNPDALVFSISEVHEKELFELAMELFSAIPTKHMANVSFLTASPTNELQIEKATLGSAEGLEVATSGEMSIPANEVAAFPRNLRRVAMETIPASSEPEVESGGGN